MSQATAVRAEGGIPGKFSYLTLAYIDAALTILVLQFNFSEINPLVRFMLASPWLYILVKLAMPAFIAWLVPARLLIPSIAFMLLVFIWNLKELFLPFM